MKSDLEIVNETSMDNIEDILKLINLKDEDYEVYGKYKAKVFSNILRKFENNNDGKVILVTGISPTPAGEGKTTITIGIGDAFRKLNKKSIICLREPSLGPVFGIKGGATGGGYSQVVPMVDINLHFNGDLHAIGAANNLLAAIVDNHIFHGNKLNIDPKKITWKRVIDINDRQLRNIISGIGSRFNGIPREDGFDITVASEIMAIFCLSNNLEELKNNLGNIVIGYTYEDKPITCRELNCEGALTVLLKNAFNPNVVQTLEKTPVFIHGGPFANIAHGCSSIIATKIAIKLGDIIITESGFGADLGAEKFINIKCRKGKIKPSVIVLVATVRGLKYHGRSSVDDITLDLDLLKKGINNLKRHINNISNVYKLPVIVAINRFYTDKNEEIKMIVDFCKSLNVQVSICDVFSKGGEGGIDIAEKILNLVNEENDFKFVYETNRSIVEKIESIASKIYGANGIKLSYEAIESIKKIEKNGYDNLPICIAKTPYSFSDDPKNLDILEDFTINIKDVKLNAGAGFIVVFAGNILTMPGLPVIPMAENIDIDKDGNILGLS